MDTFLVSRNHQIERGIAFISKLGNIYYMVEKKKSPAKKETLDKAIYVKASQEFVDMLNESQWHLRMKPAQIVRESVVEYLKRHLPKEVKDKLLKHIKK